MRVRAVETTGSAGFRSEAAAVTIGEQTYAGEWCMDAQGTSPAVFTNITADMTVYAVYTIGYNVTLRGGEGYTLSAVNNSKSPVKEGGSFTFRFTLGGGYQKNADFAVKVNGAKVELAADGTGFGQSTGIPIQQEKVKFGNGTVIVTVVCEEEKCTAVVADISEKVPGLVLGMYVDISMFIKIGAGDWNAITETKEPIEVVVTIPEKLQSDGREYYIIRAHNGGYTFMNDIDDAPATITISTDMFLSYAIAYMEPDGTAADTDAGTKCGLCTSVRLS